MKSEIYNIWKNEALLNAPVLDVRIAKRLADST